MLLDFVCIALAIAVLYVANKQMLPQWLVIIGAILAAVFLCASIYYLMKARRIEKENLKALEETELEEPQKEENEPVNTES